MKVKIVTILLVLQVLILNRSVKAQLPGMYVDGRYLYSATGDTVILKGFNAMIVYWDIHGDVNFPEIEKTGANCVRIFWNLDYPTPQPEDLDKVLNNCILHHMIPIICLWDATGKWNKIQQCVNYWTSPLITPILKKYERHLIVNIANEPGDAVMGDSTFRSTYKAAVNQIRDAGLHTPLIIDADNWGRNADAVLDNGEYLLQEDPDHNLVFSWHLWDPENWGTGTKPEIDRIITKAAGKNICFIVGEFGPCEQCDRCSATKINWEYLIEKAYKNDIGYLPWVWKWTDCHSIVNNTTGSYGSWVNSPWGESVAVSSLFSIKKTAKRPSELYIGVDDTQPETGSVIVKPNPFTGAVEFSIDLRYPASLEISIFDIKGSKVDTLMETAYVPGIVIMKWIPGKEIQLHTSAVLIYRIDIKSNSGSYYRSGKLIKI